MAFKDNIFKAYGYIDEMLSGPFKKWRAQVS